MLMKCCLNILRYNVSREKNELYIVKKRRRVLLDCQVPCVLLNVLRVGKLYMQYVCVRKIDVLLLS